MPSELLTRPYRWLRIRLPQPWSRWVGLAAYSPRLVRGHAPTQLVFEEEPVIERLASGRQPLAGIGVGMTERVVEIPWTLRRLPTNSRKHVLDVGTAFAVLAYKRLLARQPHDIETVDLAKAHVPGLKSHVADVRRLPFADGSFDIALCISTLEHVGMDNAAYGIASGGGGDVQALRELGRVARRVLVTVPAGCDRDMGWQRQYAPSTFRRLVEAAGLDVEQLELFSHDPRTGWSQTDEASVATRNYGDGATAAAALLCAELVGRG